MAASAAKVVQAVKTHVPLIKFPDRKAVVEAVAAAPSVFSSNAPASAPQTTAPSKPVGVLPRGMGINDKEMPLKYRRKPLSDEEIDYILRGGPE